MYRWTTADAYLKPALKARKNLKVALNMQVRRILFDKSGKIATGVEVTRDWGRTVFHVSILEFAQNILKMIEKISTFCMNFKGQYI